MRSSARVALVILLAILVFIPAVADKAKSLYTQGKDAEARQNYELAYQCYKQAYDLNPKDLRYRAAAERTKFLASASKVHRGQLLRDAGKLNEALAEFEAAALIDPANYLAQQEARRTRKLLEDAQRRGPPQSRNEEKPESAVAEAAAPVQLGPLSQTPINALKMVEDSRVVYETVGKLAGLNVLFDPDYASKRIRIELSGVTVEQALEIVSLESHTFWRPITPNTIYIAPDSQTKRNELDQQVLRTFYLGNISTPTELQDVNNTLRTILKIERVQNIPAQNAIVVRGTPDQIALAEKVIGDIDKAQPEVVVEVVVMQVQRDKLRNLGIAPPFSTTANPSIQLQSNTGSSGSGGSGSSTTTPLTLNDLANLDARNFVVSIPAVTVAALASDSDTKVIEQPSIRALQGQKATLKIGQRVPVATGSYASTAGVSGAGISPLVNTQFQYQDVGVNIEITPYVHMNHDVTLKISIEVSSIVNYQSMGGGVTEPIIGQRKIEHTIRLKDGEVNLMGGMLEQTETQSVSGIPWLSNIPILRYLFAQTSKERLNNEIVFALIPRVVRDVDLTDLNTRGIDIGTSNVVQMRRVSPVKPAPATIPASQPAAPMPGVTPAAGATPPPAQPAAETPQPAAPATVTTPAPAAVNPAATKPASNLGTMGSGPLLSFDPPLINQPSGATFTVNVQLTGAQNVYSVPAQIVWDNKVLQLVNVAAGPLLSKDGLPVALVHREDAEGGSLMVTATRPPNSPGVGGDGTVFVLTFLAKAPGKATIAVNRALLRDPSLAPVQATGSQAMVTIR